MKGDAYLGKYLSFSINKPVYLLRKLLIIFHYILLRSRNIFISVFIYFGLDTEKLKLSAKEKYFLQKIPFIWRHIIYYNMRLWSANLTELFHKSPSTRYSKSGREIIFSPILDAVHWIMKGDVHKGRESQWDMVMSLLCSVQGPPGRTSSYRFIIWIGTFSIR